ncbi:lipid A biosynthesis acyltransferase [Sulfurimonas hongkongensis]|uniref:Lipid A biosynthesis acyltransferase n=1 Tax=Sulfurimonas hongkongensis TaxID=1172190 RepID=T0JPF2_9BACT|nr:lipid A biosynthesis lauroyl acyltransferase [Sulfurimonas hongkongensis]EQB40061.1 lipid A biosynthesis acyltransferase [Sulfurimonas hongkongensis]
MIGFYAFLILEKILMLLPKKLRRSFFIALSFIAFKLSKRYNKVIRDNLKFVYGDDVSEEFIQDIAKASFRQLLLNLLHTMEIRYYSIEELATKVSFKNDEVVRKAQEQNRPIIFISGHYGSWELAGAMLGALREPFMTVYKKMKNKYFEKYLLSSRSKSRMKYVEKKGATRSLLKHLRANKSVLLLIDTNVNKKEAITVDFLGKPTSQVKTTAYLARKFDAALIPILVHAIDDENFVIEFYDEIIPPKTDDEEQDIRVSTQMQTDWLTQEILKDPKPWFWLHRRFKNDYPEIYKS